MAALNPLKSDLLSPLVPTFHQAVGPEALRARGSSYVAGRITENGGYLGVLLIVALVVVVVVARKNRIVQISAALGFFAFVLSLGSPLVVNGHSTNIPLPFAALEHLPLIQSLVASRFSLYVVFFASLIFGVGINRLMSSRARHLGFTATSARAAAIGLGVLVLVPLVPKTNYGVGNVNVPPYLLSAAGTRDIPDGSAVLAYPFPLDPVDQAMLWQAQAGMRFSLVGGYAVFAAAGKSGTFQPALLAPTQVQGLLLNSWPLTAYGLTRPTESPATVAAVRAFVARYDIHAVIVDREGAHPDYVIRILTKALGPPQRMGQLDIWRTRR